MAWVGSLDIKSNADQRQDLQIDMSSSLENVQRGVVKLCKPKFWKKLLPITSWLPKYDLECLVGDSVAGFTVGLTVLPQALAYATVAGLDPVYGLYSSFIGCFMYVIFGSCKDITIGPTAIMSIMTHEYSLSGNTDVAVFLCFLSGIIILLAGIVNLGFLINFISKPVIHGFTSAAAITIAASQLKGWFGLKFQAEGFVEIISEFFHSVKEFRWQDLVLGTLCIIVLLLMRKMKDLSKVEEGDVAQQRAAKKIIFLLSVSRNAIVVVIASIFAYVVPSAFTITGYITPGLPPFAPPPFETVIGNTTYYFSDMISTLGSGIIIIPMIGILENIAIGSAFAGGKTINATQEMIALGICNILGSFVRSYPVTGSFSRTAVNSTSGVRTPAGGIVTGLLVVIALAFLTPYFKFIPKAALAGVIICAVIFMVEYEVIVPIWKVRKTDEVVLWITFLSCLFWKLEFGILIGAAVNISFYMFGVARPKINVKTINGEGGYDLNYVVVEPSVGLFFPTSEYIRTQIAKAGIKEGSSTLPVVIDCVHFTGIDYTAAKGIKGLMQDFASRKQLIFFTGVSPEVEQSLIYICDNIKILSAKELLSVLLENREYEVLLSNRTMNSYGSCSSSVHSENRARLPLINDEDSS